MKVKLTITEVLKHSVIVDWDEQDIKDHSEMPEEKLNDYISDYTDCETIEDGIWEDANFEVIKDEPM